MAKIGNFSAIYPIFDTQIIYRKVGVRFPQVTLMGEYMSFIYLVKFPW
jgi:hypothetical protein